MNSRKIMQISQMLICNKCIAWSRDKHLSKRQLTHMHLSISTADLCLTITLVLEPDSCHTSMFMHYVNFWRLNYFGFFHDFQHQLNWQLQYNWNIIYSGVLNTKNHMNYSFNQFYPCGLYWTEAWFFFGRVRKSEDSLA
jgi:hypothetical protein